MVYESTDKIVTYVRSPIKDELLRLDSQAIISQLSENDPIYLEREPWNHIDKNAVYIYMQYIR